MYLLQYLFYELCYGAAVVKGTRSNGAFLYDYLALATEETAAAAAQEKSVDALLVVVVSGGALDVGTATRHGTLLGARN